MQYKHIRQRPQAELNAALLQLLAVRTAPGIVWGQLKHTQNQSRTSSNHTAYKIGLTQDGALSFSQALFSSRAIAGKSHNHNVYVGLCSEFLVYTKRSIRSQIHSKTTESEKLSQLQQNNNNNNGGRTNVRLYFKIYWTLTCVMANLKFIFWCQITDRAVTMCVFVYACTVYVHDPNFTCSSLV